MKHFNFLIVGQGLAGSLFAYHLLKENKSFLVLDNNNEISSSKVAAGMFSPVGGKRMLKTWLADDLINYLDNIYLDLENILQTKFYYKQKILHVFQENESNIYDSVSNLTFDDERYQYIEKSSKLSEDFNNLNNSIGSIIINKAGWVNTEKLLNSFSNYLKNNNQLLNEQMIYSDLIYKDNKWYYKEYSFDKVVFCEGFKSTKNPYFKYLPFQLCKGEVINIEVENLSKNYILKKGIYLVNLKENNYKVGASYEWKDLSLETTEKGINSIKNKLDKFIITDYKIIRKTAGIRPTVLDKKPLLGEHKDFKNMYIFNGLGTKGVMLAPYFSKILSDFILYNKEIPLEVDIKRF